MNQPPLKILIDARAVQAQTHGIGRYTAELIRGLARLGQEVSIISHSNETINFIGREYVQREVRIKSAFLDPRELIELSLLKVYRDFDVVHFPSFSVPLKIPDNAIITIHDLTHLYAPSKLAHLLYYHTVVRHALARCKNVITVSEWSKNEIHRLLKTPLQKIAVVRNGLEDHWFEKPSGARPIEELYFLCLSNPKPHKNVRTLIKACQKLWNERIQFKLALSLGGGDILNEWGISQQEREKLTLLKSVDDSELKKYFRHGQALISTSFYEGFNYPVAEALAQQTRVILSRGSANDEFHQPLVEHYGQPEDHEALAESMKKALGKGLPVNSGGQPNRAKILTTQEMARDTLKVYLSQK